MARARLRVLTLNIWNRCGPHLQRAALIREGIRELAPDVIGLQEVVQATEGDMLDQLALLNEGLGYHGVFGRTPLERGYPFGNAVLSRWPIGKSDVFPLPRGGTDQYRNVTYAEIDAPFGKLPFFTTHLNWKLHEGRVRAMQVREIADRVKALAPVDGFPPIVTGDFNAEPESDEIRFMRGWTALGGDTVYFADCHALVGDLRDERGGMRGGMRGGATFCRRNPYAHPCREPDRRIDYVFVRGPDDRGRGEPLESIVCFDRPSGEIWPTDHFGVLATLSIEA
jgi:endonuclease/exonuclease/phosphatase family metal-dependent hydrolase